MMDPKDNGTPSYISSKPSLGLGKQHLKLPVLQLAGPILKAKGGLDRRSAPVTAPVDAALIQSTLGGATRHLLKSSGSRLLVYR